MGDEARLIERPPLVYGHSARCLNCDATISGDFCSACGQRDVPPYPSVRELASDAFAEFSGWDGRLASTLRALVRSPGFLTHEFLEGRRVRYISPLRLYLMTSLVYFLIAAAAPNRARTGEVSFGGMSVGVSTTTASSGPLKAPQRVAKAADKSLKGGQPMTAAERDAALKDISHAPAVLQPLLRRVVVDPVGFKRGLRETMPRMLFVLLPLFAGIVALFYRGRKYPEHLYFAIHLHAFAFLALAAMELLKFSRVPVLVAAAATGALIAIPIYSTMAFRRVYGGSVAGTIGKEVGIGLLYALVSGLGFILMIYWVSLVA
jgi:hypothetical protein